MALTTGPNLGLLFHGAEGDEHYDDLMKQWRWFDMLIQPHVLDKDLTAPPGSPADGDVYIVGPSATGAWATHDDDLARYSGELTAWEFLTPKAGWFVYVQDEALQYTFDSGWAVGSGAGLAPTEHFAIACSDLTTALTAGTAKVTFFMPYAFTVTEIFAALVTPQTGNGAGGIFTVDVNEAGATILSTKITIDNGESTSLTAATAPVLSDTALAKGAKITVDIDQIGDGTAKGLQLYIIGHQ